MNKIFTRVIGGALGLAMALGVGVAAIHENVAKKVEAAEATVSKTITTIVTDNKYTVSSGNDVTCYTSFALDSYITISTTGTANCGSFWEQTTGSKTYEWRLYQNKSGNFKVTANNEAVLKSITITYYATNTGTLKDGSTNVATGSTQSLTGSTKTFTVGNTGSATNGQVRVREISVTYEKPSNVITALSVAESSKAYTLGDAINLSSFTLSVTKNGSAGSLDDVNVYVGKGTGNSFVSRATVTSNVTAVTMADETLRFVAKYASTDGATFLSDEVSLTINYATLTSFSATESLVLSAGETGQIEITVNANANPGATYVSNNPSVATVDEDGIVTAVGFGEATITSTSVALTSSSQHLTDTTTISVSYDFFFVASGDQFGTITEAAARKSVCETKSLGGNEWTLTGEGVNNQIIRIMAATKDYGQQFGTADYPFGKFELESSLFGNYKITKVVIKVRGASGSSSPSTGDIYVSVGGTSFGEYQSYSGQTIVTKEFSGSGSFGKVKIEFKNIVKGFQILEIKLVGASEESNTGLAHAFAKRVESFDSCAGDKSALISAYDSLTASVKELADPIAIKDWNGTADAKGTRTLSLTVADKMAAIKASVPSAKTISASASSFDVSTIVVIISSISLVALGGFLVIRRKKEQ